MPLGGESGLGAQAIDLTPVDGKVSLGTLPEATRLNARRRPTVGAHQVRHDRTDEGVRLAYCRALAQAIVAESTLPAPWRTCSNRGSRNWSPR